MKFYKVTVRLMTRWKDRGANILPYSSVLHELLTSILLLSEDGMLCAAGLLDKPGLDLSGMPTPSTDDRTHQTIETFQTSL